MTSIQGFSEAAQLHWGMLFALTCGASTTLIHLEMVRIQKWPERDAFGQQELSPVLEVL